MTFDIRRDIILSGLERKEIEDQGHLPFREVEETDFTELASLQKCVAGREGQREGEREGVRE